MPNDLLLWISFPFDEVLNFALQNKASLMAELHRIHDNNTAHIALPTYLSNSSLQDRFGCIDAVVFARPIHVFEMMLVFCIRIKLRLRIP